MDFGCAALIVCGRAIWKDRSADDLPVNSSGTIKEIFKVAESWVAPRSEIGNTAESLLDISCGTGNIINSQPLYNASSFATCHYCIENHISSSRNLTFCSYNSSIFVCPIMPTPVDRALQSRNLFFGFAGLVALASLSSIFGGEMFPAQKDPTGDPETWTDDDLRRWLKNVSLVMFILCCHCKLTRTLA